MTSETISSDTFYSFDDIAIGDRIKVERGADVMIGRVGDAGPDKEPYISVFGAAVRVDRGDRISLIHRPDLVADVVKAWTETSGHRTRAIHSMMTSDLRSAWPNLAEALDALAKARP